MFSQLVLFTPALSERYYFPIKPLEINFISTNRANPGSFSKKFKFQQQSVIKIRFKFKLQNIFVENKQCKKHLIKMTPPKGASEKW
jgi:CRISPR/Cas system-associated protein Csx1